MNQILRALGVVGVFCLATVAWLVLGAVMTTRTGSQSSELRGKVADLWGQPHAQAGPAFGFEWTTPKDVSRMETTHGVERQVVEHTLEAHQQDVSIASTRVAADLHLDQRLKGLMWYSLYDVAFRGGWTYVHAAPIAGDLRIRFKFPDPAGVYDGFRFVVDGQPHDLRPQNGEVQLVTPVQPGQKVDLAVQYKSRGMDEWRYVVDPNVANLKDFELAMTTDFAEFDFPPSTLSPSTRERTASGWKLVWAFQQVVTGHSIGISTPQRIQPGQLAAALSFSAPVSLLFFFLLVLVLGRLRGLDIHPINYLFLAAAFFAFHLLFAYSVDHVTIGVAFALSSAVSIFLVVSYLRLVVSPRFAFVEAALAQLVYLVGFSLAHFWDGFTGLTVTVLSIVTLFLLMQMTGRIRWSGGLSPRPTSRPMPDAAGAAG